MIQITPPHSNEYPEYYGTYISKVKGDNLLEHLSSIHKQTNEFLKKIPNEKLNYRYAEGKWSIKEIIGHLLDTERVMSYRALRFARFDKTPLPGFEENDWAKASNAAQRNFLELLNEFDAVRDATICLFKSFDDKILTSKGTANNKEISVRALGYIIAGHELHHAGVIKERYL
jgi:uncharacterized damage-inducible protein DinB